MDKLFYYFGVLIGILAAVSCWLAPGVVVMFCVGLWFGWF